MKSLSDQLQCARRELALRQRVYPCWVRQGRLTREKAQHETECMDAIVSMLEKARRLEEVSQEMRGGT